jgi:aldose sugar dehydrogenase
MLQTYIIQRQNLLFERSVSSILIIIVPLLAFTFIGLFGFYYYTSFSTASAYVPILRFSKEESLPQIKDPHLKVEIIANGLKLPTSIAFLGPDDMLVLEKDNGTVKRIVNGKMLSQPLLDVNVATQIERCMCGIAISRNDLNRTYVFLYYTEADGRDGGPAINNRLYRYEMTGNNKLTNPVLLLNLPALPGPRHNGGAIIIGPDNDLYVPIGDVDGHRTKSENFNNGPPVDGTGGILRINQDGSPLSDNPLGNTYPLNLYYAYGIRNSFGIDFDPVTGELWDTENGPGYGDEINLVQPGFNSGWGKIQGLFIRDQYNKSNHVYGADDSKTITQSRKLTSIPRDLVDFAGKGIYSPPEFTWNHTVGPTGIKFFNSNKYGPEYENALFVGDVHNGNLYLFKLNNNRTMLALPTTLQDKIANNPADVQQIIFGKGFGGISDLEVGPDGNLYVVSIGQGRIFKIVSNSEDGT